MVLPPRRPLKSSMTKVLDVVRGHPKRPKKKELEAEFEAKMKEVNKGVDTAEKALLTGELQPEDFSD